MDPVATKRESYSFFVFQSVLHRTAYSLDSASLLSALVLVETTPGVTGWKRVREEFTFTCDGKERPLSLPLAVVSNGARRSLVQLVQGDGNPVEARAIEEGRRYATSKGYAHWAVSGRDLLRNRIELLNRECAHSWLLHASSWDTHRLEERAAQLLECSTLKLSELTAELGLSLNQTRVVLIRGWLRGALKWDVANTPITSDFEVCRA